MLHEVATLFAAPTDSSAADRRITRRLLNAWAQAARGRFPSWSDMRRTDLGSDWNWCFVIDLREEATFPHFVYLGSCLAKLSDVYLSGGDWSESLLDIATAGIQAAAEEGAPVTRDCEVTLCDGRLIAFRAIAAPLSEDGDVVTHVFGAATGRILGGA